MSERHLRLLPPPEEPTWKEGSPFWGWLVLAIVLVTMLVVPHFVSGTSDKRGPSYADCVQDGC